MATMIVPKRRRRRRWPWILLALIVVGGGVSIFVAQKAAANTKNAVTADDLDVRQGKSEVGDIQVTVAEVGTIEPVVKVDVKSPLSGKVIELLVQEGERVSRGQVLARVEPDVNQAQTLSQVKSELNLAEIKAQDAEKDLMRNRKLHEEGYVSDTDLKNFQVVFDTSQEGLAAARTRMRIVEESGIPLDQQISTTQRVNVVSPMDGYVIQKNVEVGQTVTSGMSSFNEGTAIYTVADLNSMLIKAAINEVDIGRVRLGMPVAITVDAFPYKHFNGKVSHISPAARLKEKLKVFDIEVTLESQVPEFRAGMTTNIEVLGDKATKVLGVPVEAIFKREGGEAVFVLKDTFDPPGPKDGKPRRNKSGKIDISDNWQRFFEQRKVKVGLAGLERAQILEGLKSGEKIALEDPTRPRQIAED